MTLKEEESDKDLSDKFTVELEDSNNIKHQVGDSLWKYFDVTDEERSLAKCIFCEEVVSYNDGQQSLADHLLIMHTINVQDPLSDSQPAKGKRVNAQPRLGLNIRDFFVAGEDDQDSIVCCLCGDQLPEEKSYGQMLEHMAEKHHIVEDTRASRESSMDEERDTKPRKREKSSAWKYFTLRDNLEKTAACNLCGTVCSYRSSVTNLLKHVQRKHTDGVPPVKRRRINISKAWTHFKQLDHEEKTALCLVCKKSFSYATSVSNLRKHVCRKHPGLLDAVPGDYANESELHTASEDHAYGKELQPDGENHGDSQQDHNESDAVEVEYLEVYQDDLIEVPDNILHERKPDPVKPDRKPVLSHRKDSCRDRSSGADGAADESLDHFGPYIVSLLKQLPRKASNRLQVEFVRQVIEAQAMCDSSTR